MARPRGSATILDPVPSRPEALRFTSRPTSAPSAPASSSKTLFDSPIALEFDQLCLQREARRRRRRSAPVISWAPSGGFAVQRGEHGHARPASEGLETAGSVSAEVDSDRESDQSSDDERADGSDTDTDAAHGRGRPRTRQNGLRPRRPERKSLDKGMWDFLHMVREKGEGGRYTAVRTLLAPVKPIRSALASRTGDGEQGEHGAEKTDLEGELVEEGIIEPAERRGSRLQVESVEGDDNGSSVDLRIERNLTTAVKRSELLIEGFADVVRQIEDANVGDHKKDELLEEVLDRMPPEGPFELP